MSNHVVSYGMGQHNYRDTDRGCDSMLGSEIDVFAILTYTLTLRLRVGNFLDMKIRHGSLCSITIDKNERKSYAVCGVSSSEPCTTSGAVPF